MGNVHTVVETDRDSMGAFLQIFFIGCMMNKKFAEKAINRKKREAMFSLLVSLSS